MTVAELMIGPRAAFGYIAVLAVVLCAVIAVARSAGISWWRRPAPTLGDAGTVEATAGYRRYVLAALAGGSQQSWDATVRPVLAELAESTCRARAVGQSDDLEAARDVLGDGLFACVDPTVRPCFDRSRSGPTVADLLSVLERLEGVRPSAEGCRSSRR